MTQSISAAAVTAVLAAATISVMAQAPPPGASATSEHKITVTGCLKAAPPAATDSAASAQPPDTAGTTGTAGATAASDPASARFVLADATMSPAAGEPAAAAKEPAQTYRLIANPVALGPHVGKKLELTGTLDQSAAASSGAGDPAAGPVLRVEAGKILAASCQN